ncbi:SMI1/KNR4 family protein [Pseudomonadota bacterium]
MPFNLDEKYVLEAEEALKGTLPQSYKSAMLQSNGGEIELDDETWELYPIFDKSDKKRISRTCNHIISETQSCIGFGNFPQSAVAIAGNGCGDQLVLIKTESCFSNLIYLWSHETGAIIDVASDFSELDRL